MPRGRGGKRTPKNPAAVSGPGKLARRTDGGPGQPVRLAPAEFHGQRQQMTQLQQAAPMAAGTEPPPGAGLPPFAGQAFRTPTDRPGEPVTAGAPFGPGAPAVTRLLPDDPLELLRAVYAKYPTEGIRRLLERSGG